MRGGRETILLQGLLRVREKVSRGSDQLSAIIQCLICERMELAADGIDVRERQLPRVRAVREQDKNALTFSVDPTACAGEACMTERIGWKARAGGRIFCGGELPGKGTRLVQAFRKTLPKELASLRIQQLR